MAKKLPTPPKQTDGKDRKGYDVTPEQFIEIWQASESAQEAADKLKMPKGIALARASAYRNLGIRLKKMEKKGRTKLDVKSLNDLIAKVNKKMGLPPPEPLTAEDAVPKGDRRLPVTENTVRDIIHQVMEKLHE